MVAKPILPLVLAAALAATPATRATADLKDALGAAVLLGIIGGATQQQRQRQRVSNRSTVSAAQRQQNRDIQSALNYFNYPVGAVDGIIGRGTRGAIRNFEAAMGLTVDGNLDEYERNFLVGSHQRALASSTVAPYNRILAAQGTRGLLQTFNNERRGIPTASPKAPQQVATVTAPAAASAPKALPTFGAVTAPKSASIADHCSAINVLTSTNGGFTTLGTMTNPAFVLDEQFCLARTAATAEGERVMGSIINVTPAQLSAQCDSLGAFMQPQLAALQDDEPADVTNNVQANLRASGQSMEQLASAGVVCLGLGYKEDKAEVALGSALLMVGTGQSAYGEMVAHQLRGGFGTTKCEACSNAWMGTTIKALEDGAAPAFLPNQSADRTALLNAASLGRGAPTTSSAGALPTFGASD